MHSPHHPLRQSLRSLRHISAFPRINSRFLAAVPVPPPPTPGDEDSSFPRLFLRWLSGIAAGSTLGYAYWSSSSSSIPSFAECSTTLSSNPTAAMLDHRSSDSASPNSFWPRLLFDAYRRKVFFKYEKRIRMRSPPEKVFEYFASSHSSDGELLMTPADLMRAIVPVFPPSESNFVRDGYLKGERNPGQLRCVPSEFFMLFDMDNDGHISFKEYIFFVTLLSIPESSFSVAFKMFDINHDGEIDREEFKKVMALMRAQNRQGAVHSNGLRFGLKVDGSVENGGLVEYFFGKDGKEYLHHDKFVNFLRSLHEEMLRLEFDHYDYKGKGTISAKDFALSVVASADMGNLSKLLNRVDELDHTQLGDIRITFDEFKNFSELRHKLQPLSLALFSYGKVNSLLTRKDFQRAASHVCDVSLSDSVVELIFHVFDANCDGSLSWDEFVRVLEKRQRDIVQPMEAGIMSFLSCCWNCKSTASFARLLS